MRKYGYLYQNKQNETCTGYIKARDRATAYAKIRQLGIRPYRVIGDDPPPWLEPLKWMSLFLIVGLIGALIGWGIIVTLPPNSLPRQQLVGDRAIIDEGVYSGWVDVLPEMLDRQLAAYAQPGRIAIAPEITPEEIASLDKALERDIVFVKGEREEYRLLKRILCRMREDMREYLASGGTVADYLAFLDERQEEEHDFRERALDAVLRSPDSMRERVLLGVNARLRDRSIEPIVLGGGEK